MSEANGLFNNIIKGIKDIKLFAIDKLSDMNFFSMEAPFLDNEFVSQIIKELEVLYERSCIELKQYDKFLNDDAYYIKKYSEIKSQKNNVAVQLAFFLSLDSEHVQRSIQLLKDVDDDFNICLDAIDQYNNSNYDEALNASYQYVKALGKIPEHYRFNQIISELFIRDFEYKKAIPFLRRAIEKKPEELELHKMILLCYQYEDMEFEMGIEKQIINLLEV